MGNYVKCPFGITNIPERRWPHKRTQKVSAHKCNKRSRVIALTKPGEYSHPLIDDAAGVGVEITMIIPCNSSARQEGPRDQQFPSLRTLDYARQSWHRRRRHHHHHRSCAREREPAAVELPSHRVNARDSSWRTSRTFRRWRSAWGSAAQRLQTKPELLLLIHHTREFYSTIP